VVAGFFPQIKMTLQEGAVPELSARRAARRLLRNPSLTEEAAKEKLVSGVKTLWMHTCYRFGRR
jgi:hypothetical protein